MTGPPSPKRQRTGEKTEDAAPAADAAVPVVDEKVQKVLDSIATVSEEIDAEEQKMNREIIKLEAKYNAAKRPFYEKRSKLLRDIPGFWKQALSNHPFIAASLSEGEAKVFESVEDLDVTFIDEAGGFKIELTFGENAYFGKGKLWKEITYKEDGEYEVKSSGVAWKDSKEATEGKEESIFFEWFASVDGDQSVAEHIKDDIWKNPVPYYLNEEDSDDEGEEGDDDEEDEDEEEEADEE